MEAAEGRTPISTSHIAACLNELKTEDAIIINELGVPMSQLQMTKQGSYMGSLLAGGLGFGLGAALGAKLAAPEREVISVVGDGSYMFGNPLPFHYVGRAESLPTLTIISNNQSWHAVRAATLDVFPGGYAAKANIDAVDRTQADARLRKGDHVLRRHRRKGRAAGRSIRGDQARL